MKPLDRSSGDLLADRRADYAEMLFGSGDHAAAAELMLGALELAPGWAMGWFRLGEMQETAGAPDRAGEAWRMALKLDPADRAGAALKLELIGEAPSSAAPPSPFVEALFDQYAKNFDASLVEKLGYRVPELLDGAIRAQRDRFDYAIDLGCGTGLMGERLRPMAKFLEGYDISAAMLKKAETKRIYDKLAKADLQTIRLAPESADLVTAADVFMYVGALDGVFATVAAVLKAGGLFAFSVEAHEGPEDVVLRTSRRYAHSEAYLRRLLENAGLSVVSLDRADIRMDRGAAIEGLIVVAQRL
ncbi:class I SAM-dependent DNA methyltransferase [Mesorhizobium sp. ZC-5]|uniref:class I SAM-dependent DNA methyltransferase n=1 Tax=Mesorhizobium sp. ZC-5 TaxID=2986066 RepID=UPI0021E82BD7|nr:methyltransferase domain-containing protein [Mesorhizobium sp. ZC-5]MCV3243213.1 methyltransferase domain-containing protein [Mesorhizobium sp. ZC-5]